MTYKDPEYSKKYYKDHKDKWVIAGIKRRKDHKEEIKKYFEEYAKIHSVRLAEYSKEYRRLHKGISAEYSSKYYQKNKTCLSAKNRQHYIENKDKILSRNRIYRLKNIDTIISHKRDYYLRNKDEISIKGKMYRIKNNEKISKRRKIYREKNKLKRNEYCRNRKRDDIQFKLQCSIRSRLVGALKDCAKSGSAVRDLGCTIPELKVHIEKQFQQGMTWDNWNKTGWHIDHKIPLDAFDLTNREQFLSACHYTNLQPMWAKENLEKKNKLIWPEYNKAVTMKIA